MLSNFIKPSFLAKIQFSGFNFSKMVTLKKDTNQALALGKYAIDFMKNGQPSQKVLDRTKVFHTDAVVCGLSALAMKTNAPTVLRNEALHEYPGPKSN